VDLGDLNNTLDDLLDDAWYLDNLLDDLLHFNNLFNDIVDISNDLDGNVHDLLNFLYLDDLHDLFYNLFDRNDLRNLNDSLDHLLYDLLHLHDLGHNSEDFQDIVNINDTHDLLVNHSDDSLVHL
jgi:hypothetical protein